MGELNVRCCVTQRSCPPGTCRTRVTCDTPRGFSLVAAFTEILVFCLSQGPGV